MNYFAKANDLYKVKNYENALEMYQKSVEVKEFEAPSLYNSAVCFIKLKDYKSALDLIYRALELRTESKYFFNLAYCYVMLGDNPKALHYFNAAWSHDNTDDECEKAIDLILSKYKKSI